MRTTSTSSTDRSSQLWRKPYVDGAVRELTSGRSRSQEQIRQAVEQMMIAAETDNQVPPRPPHIKSPPAGGRTGARLLTGEYVWLETWPAVRFEIDGHTFVIAGGKQEYELMQERSGQSLPLARLAVSDPQFEDRLLARPRSRPAVTARTGLFRAIPKMEQGGKSSRRGFEIVHGKCGEKAGDELHPHEATGAYGPVFGVLLPL